MEIPEFVVIILGGISALTAIILLILVLISINAYIQRHRQRKRAQHYKKLLQNRFSISKDVIPLTYPAEIQAAFQMNEKTSLYNFDYNLHKGDELKQEQLALRLNAIHTSQKYWNPTHFTDEKSTFNTFGKPELNRSISYGDSICKVFPPKPYRKDGSENSNEPPFYYDQPLTVKTDNTDTLGYLNFALFYDNKYSTFTINIKEVIESGVTAEIPTYVTFCLIPEDFEWYRTKSVHQHMNDISFNETFDIEKVLYHKLREYTVAFFVMNEMEHEKPIGRIVFSLNDIRKDQEIDLCMELLPS